MNSKTMTTNANKSIRSDFPKRPGNRLESFTQITQITKHRPILSSMRTSQ